MSYIVNGVKAKKVGVLLEPSTYDTDTSPVDVQHGAVYYAHGERRVGTGKCFEFAEYGLKTVDLLIDTEGIERYGIDLELKEGTNLILISSAKGDVFVQTKHLVTLLEGTPIEIGQNVTSGGEIYALQAEGHLKIYFASLQDKNTRLRYFYGKDNEI